MQIKEFEAFTLKECLQQVRSEMGAEAVILETRKFRKGGIMGLGARDAVAIVAATGITVTSDLPHDGVQAKAIRAAKGEAPPAHRVESPPVLSAASATRPTANRSAAAARVAALGVYGSKTGDREEKVRSPISTDRTDEAEAYASLLAAASKNHGTQRGVEAAVPLRRQVANDDEEIIPPWKKTGSGIAANGIKPATRKSADIDPSEMLLEDGRVSYLERAMGEIRECLVALQRGQHENHDRTVSAVISAVAPAITAVNAAGFALLSDDMKPRFPELQARMKDMGVSADLIQELFDQLPDMGAWSEQAQQPLAVSALRDLISRRISNCGPIELTPGKLKAVALIGSTGVGKTTTIAKLAAHFALMQGKRVALLTVDTYRIAAVEQLKTYSQIIGLPLSVAYNHAEVPPIIEQYADYDLLLIDTAGRSQKHIMQVGELKSLLEAVHCETHLVLSAQIKEQDMMEAARRFSAARVDRLIFTKLDETSSYGTLLNVADRTGIPLSYLTTGQKVPEDLEIAEGSKLASLILD
jgi:flagellar biosynthesis protein FlhF